MSDMEREFKAIAKIELGTGKLEYVHSEHASDIDLLKQSPDGKYLAYTVNSKGYSKLKILQLMVRSTKERELSLPKNSIVLDLDWSPDSSQLCLVITSSTLNTDVWVCEISRSEKLRKVTQLSTSCLPRASFLPDKEMSYKSFDGQQISSFLYLPKNNKKQAPLIVYLHGGPESQFRPTFDPLFQYLLHLGIAIGVPNFRGSTGYGRTFTHLDDVMNRMNTVRDVENFILALKQKKYLNNRIDFSKIVAFGGSYGGFMVLACLYSNPDLWAAGVDIVGIANFVTFLQNTSPWRRKLRIQEYGDPERDRDFLLNISPVTNAYKIKAPLYVIHGTNDPRVPLGEAEQIVSTLEKLGRRVKILKFEGEGHGLHKVSDRIDALSKAIEFLLEQLQI
jgi:dipeptidyl aminopeptidase/acylaminoacyl peptidase